MDTITHGIVGALIGKGFFSERNGRVATFAATVGAMFPDVDVVQEIFSTDPLAIVKYHRAITHSFVALPFFAALLAWLTRVGFAFALLLDHLGLCLDEEIGVGELGGDFGQLRIQLADLLAQPRLLPRQIHHIPETQDQGGTVDDRLDSTGGHAQYGLEPLYAGEAHEMLMVPPDPFGCERLYVLEEERDPGRRWDTHLSAQCTERRDRFYHPFHLGQSRGIMGFR